MTFTESIKFNDGQIHPDAHATGTVNGAWVPIADYGEIVGLFALGVMATGATLTFKLQQAQDASGTGVKDIAATSTALTEAGGDGQEVVATKVLPSQIDHANGFDHVRLTAIGAVAASDYGAHLLRVRPGHSPVDNS